MSVGLFEKGETLGFHQLLVAGGVGVGIGIAVDIDVVVCIVISPSVYQKGAHIVLHAQLSPTLSHIGAYGALQLQKSCNSDARSATHPRTLVVEQRQQCTIQ